MAVVKRQSSNPNSRARSWMGFFTELWTLDFGLWTSMLVPGWALSPGCGMRAGEVILVQYLLGDLFAGALLGVHQDVRLPVNWLAGRQELLNLSQRIGILQ